MGAKLVDAKQVEFIQMTGTEHYLYGKVVFFFLKLKLRDYFLIIMPKPLYLPDLACNPEAFDVKVVDGATLAVVTTT